MLHLHHGNDEVAARRYWQQALGLSGVDFHKTFVKPPGTGHRKNRQRHGVCRVRLRRSTDAWLSVMEWVHVLAGGDL